MNTNNEIGRKYVVLVGLYLIVKVVVNLIFGGGFDFGGLIFAIVAALAMFSGLQYLNFVVAGLLAFGVARHLGYNFTHLPDTLIYLIEGVIDIGAAVLLIMQNDVKEHFTNKWSELSDMIKK